MNEMITLAHGSGGKMTHNLIKDLFYKYFHNDRLLEGGDAAVLNLGSTGVAFTTDSYVISPVFFKGGNIGKLAVCGTVNDLAVSGAKPLYLSCGFIIEEGFLFSDLEAIVASMARTAREAGVSIVTGDTKVVQRGAADKIFINTSGIGLLYEDVNISASRMEEGDRVILSGTMGDHGTAILLERESFPVKSSVASDCAPLGTMLGDICLHFRQAVHVLRDPTRGGVATTLNEIAAGGPRGIKLYEDRLPVRDEVSGICEMLGLDPLYMANEGKALIFVPEAECDGVLEMLRAHPSGREAAVIGEVVRKHPGKVFMETLTGGSRIIDMLVGDQLPRIC